jgi:hypothetical protein
MRQFNAFNTLQSWLPGRRDRRRHRSTRLELLPLEDRLAPSAAAGAGVGLVADYYSDPNLTNLARTRIDPGVNFDWGTASPDVAVPADNFSVRWTGQIQAQYSETYTFSTVSAGGIRLWVNGEEIINDWTDHTTKTDTGAIALQAGRSYDIKLEYVNNTGVATARLSWSSPSTPAAAVPATQLFPSNGWLDTDLATTGGSVHSTASTFTVTGTGTFGGMADGGHFVYQSLPGDGSVVAQASGQGGLMLRDGAAANGSEATLFLAADGIHFQARTAAGAAATDTVTPGTGPTWLKLVRDGNLVSGYSSSTSADGTWTLVGSATLSLGTTADYGFAAAGGTATITNPTVSPIVPIGANILELHDWDLNNPFVDMMKQAREFFSVSGSAGGSLVDATVDANGWPTEDFMAIVQSGFTNTAHIYNGTYKLSFTGHANVDAWITPGGSVQNLVYNAATNTTTADVILNASDSADGWYFGLRFTNSGGTVKNIQLIRPGYDPNNHPTFTTQFLNTLAPFTTLRTMQFTRTIDNPVVNWADRAHVTDATQTSDKGVAWEYVIQLANATNKDLWINIPVGATNDYVTQLATLIKNTLNPNLAVYVELSNEIWNGAYSETTAIRDAAVAEVTAGIVSGHPSNLMLPGETAQNPDGTYVHQWDWAFRYQARRTKEINDIFATVWGAGAINGRVRTVLATQLANPYIPTTQLTWLNQIYGAPSHYLYALSGAPYFAVGAADQQTNLTSSQVLNAISAATGDVQAPEQQFSALADQYGLKLVAYEGGPDTFGPNNIAAKKTAALDPQMKDIIAGELNQWFANGGGLFEWFASGPTNYDTPYGTWGVSNSLDNLNGPKTQGIVQVENGGAPKADVGHPAAGTIPAIQYVGAPQTTDPYPRYLHNGATLDYLVTSPADAPYSLAINYAEVTAGGQLRVYVNGTVVQTLNLPVSGSSYDSLWAPNSFADAQAIPINLRAGVNDIRLEVVSEGFTVNALKFVGASTPGSPAPPVVPPPSTNSTGSTGSTNSTSSSGSTSTTTGSNSSSSTSTSPMPPAAPTPPTVATAAHTAANPVGGTSVGLSVLGADAAGEAGLTYTWAAIGTPPAPVYFSANGTNAAKATTVSFTRAGTYALQVTIRDAAGLTATSNVTVTVNQALSALALAPVSGTLTAGTSVQLTPTAYDQFGIIMHTPGNISWSVTGTGAVGTVQPTGLYTASAAGGTTDTVRATVNGQSAQTTVTLAPAATQTVSTGFSYVKGFTTTGLTTNGYAGVSNGVLRLTNGGYQRGSAFFQSPVGTKRFSTGFDFQANNGSGEGIAFVLQNNSPAVLGCGGGGLGYAGIPKSFAIKFDTNGDAGIGANMVGLTVNGGTPFGPALNLGLYGMDLRGGHEFRVTVSYNSGVLRLTVADTVTGNVARMSWRIDLSQFLGSNTAFAGFTASTRGLSSTQTVLDWTFATVPDGQPMPVLPVLSQ